MYDMGLGTCIGDFEVMSKDEYDYMMMEQEENEWVDDEIVKISNDDEGDDNVADEEKSVSLMRKTMVKMTFTW